MKHGSCAYPAFFMWFLSAMLYAFQFFMRSSPNPLQQQIMQDFGATSLMFSVFSSAYYLPYAVLQIPVGIALDIIGPKVLLRWGSLICCLGTVIFALSGNFWTAVFGRFIIGFGASAIFISAIRLNTLWVSPKRLAFAIGSLTAMGKFLGGASVMITLNFLIQYMPNWHMAPWHYAILCVAAFAALISLLIWLFVRNGPGDQFVPMISKVSVKSIWEQACAVMRKPALWVIGVYGYSLYLCLSVLSDNYSIGFLAQKLNITKLRASEIAMLLPIGSGIGAPLFCFLSDHFQNRLVFLRICAMGTLLASSILFFAPSATFSCFGAFGPWLWMATLFIMGFCSGGQSLIFIVAVESVGRHYAGMALGIANGLLMLSGVIHNTIMGYILGIQARTAQGAYSLVSYQWALSSVTIMFTLAVLISWFFKDTHPSKHIKAELYQ